MGLGNLVIDPLRTGIAFSIMGLLPSIASTLAYSLPAGPAGLVWVSEIIYIRMGSVYSCSEGMVCR